MFLTSICVLQDGFGFNLYVSFNFLVYCLLGVSYRNYAVLSEWVSVTIESEPKSNSADFNSIFPILETSPERRFSLGYFTEMLLSYIFGPSVVEGGIPRNNRRSKLHSVIDCLFFWLILPLLLGRGNSRRSSSRHRVPYELSCSIHTWIFHCYSSFQY